MEDSTAVAAVLDTMVSGDETTTSVRRVVFFSLLDGVSLSFSEIATKTGLAIEVVRSVVEQAILGGVATIDGPLEGDPKVVGAEGLTLVESRHNLLIDGVDLYTWCAFDIVGIPAALGVDATGETTCATCSAVISIVITGGEPLESDVVGWWPLGSTGPVNESFCPTASMFCDPSHLDSWRRNSGANGEMLSLVDLAARGRITWAKFAS
ncbi:alkylmercury lyase [Acidithrix ferrooxidans]|uniref:Alkylmercury lyase n=2 Tax=Acidimicrobiaceae TaxID=84994 RepID=A0A0D8HPP3_9ACTN|nr:alkylmercury lyase [Acidithrix ferrooxidans]